MKARMRCDFDHKKQPMLVLPGAFDAGDQLFLTANFERIIPKCSAALFSSL